MGAYVGGTMFQKVGLIKPWPNQNDQGLFDVTKKDSDKMMFSVPTLRNVAKTAPYFHDASAATLEQAIAMMAEHQVGKTLEDADVKSIATWLNTLTGTIPEQYIVKPELPASTDKTPKPDAT
jgi:cytochrome c peroxidase